LERIAVIGIGRIGLCLALNLERAGFRVLGVDANREHVRRITARTLHTAEPDVENALQACRAFQAADSVDALREFDPDLLFVAVDTPTAETGYDHTRLDRALSEVFAQPPARNRIELALVCTVMPGYCDANSETARAHGYWLSYTPAFVAQGSILRDQRYPDQVLIGEADSFAGDQIESVFRALCLNRPSFHRMSLLSAEIAKLATNCALTMKIGFANAVGDLAVRAGAEPGKILSAIGADTRIGDAYLKYGFGYGGPCFPRDSRALNSFARSQGCELLQVQATDEMNRRHLAFQVDSYLRTYRDGEQIHFHSITYKPGTDMLDESQPLAIAEELARAGRKVVIHEQHGVVEQLRHRFGDLFEYRHLVSGTGEAEF
jgi:UDPglucose 6-dehydrogenase